MQIWCTLSKTILQQNIGVGSGLMITQRCMTLTLQEMSENVSSGLSTKQINSCLSGTGNKATSLCNCVNPQHAHIWHTASPPAQDRTQRGENSSTTRQKLLHQDQPNRAEHISPEKGLMKGNCNHEGEAWQAVRCCCCGNGIGCSLSSKPRTGESQVKPADKRCGTAGIPHPTSCSALAFLVIGWLTAKATPPVQKVSFDLQVVGGWEN